MLLLHNPTGSPDVGNAIRAFAETRIDRSPDAHTDLTQAVVRLKSGRAYREQPGPMSSDEYAAAARLLVTRLEHEAVIRVDDYRTGNDERGAVLILAREIESIALQVLPQPDEDDGPQVFN